MAKVTITLTDDEEDGFNASFEFDPPLKRGEDNETAAQLAAFVVLHALQQATSGGDLTIGDDADDSDEG